MIDGTELPLGLQLQCRPFDESTMLRVASMFQSATDFHTRRPSNVVKSSM
jgi:aspartyl-tRNA(Asn)/glutamyl-tRNA(Gln) amidotransferase subunit A